MANALVWLRRDLRLQDNPALAQAMADGYAPVLVYVHAPQEQDDWSPGAASRTWLHHSLSSLKNDIERLGGRLLITQGQSLSELERLQAESQAEALYFSNVYEPMLQARDAGVQTAFEKRGVPVKRFNANLLFEPWQIQTGGGTPYKVFTPFWRNASAQLRVLPACAAPDRLPDCGLNGLSVDALGLLPAEDWHCVFWQYWQPGEAGAHEMLDIFCDGAIDGYKEQRNLPDRTGTSKLSPHLHFGEISPQQIWRRIERVKLPESGQADIGHFKSELGWREFSYHLLHHFPKSSDDNLNPQFEHFAWADPDPEMLERWQRGRTGIPIVDAGMRELWHTGWMHNRVRMIVASFLCKNLRMHWLHGARWFWDTLLDADLANNSQGWQWTAGTGCDAAPYFRIFNPVTQAERFDPQARYIKRWVPELSALSAPVVFAPWTKPAVAAAMAPDYPSTPIADLAESRASALAAYSRR
ncbi:MAG: cryptochrome/photolyase family protein [Arenimonas sp.]|uniref:cryptochrome/photolyase family protein n=1 Tax=Arenimonas sp. TaxID=1872635 RepID=UPI003C03C721